MTKYRSLIMRKVLEEDTAFLSNKYIISILLSLSKQSKINEFCWNYSSEEKEIIKKIENNILKNNYNNTELLFFAIKAISTYKNIFLNDDISMLPNMVSQIHKTGDIIITMGAGDVYKQNNKIFKAIS